MTTDTLLLLVILGAANHQVTHIITVGVIFEGLRQWITRTFGAKAGYLVQCHLCAGTWVGFGQAGWTYGQIRMTQSEPLDAFLVAFTVALIGRLVNEVLALMAAKVQEIRNRVEYLH